jgi:predicted permease
VRWFRSLYRLALGAWPRHFRVRHGAQAFRIASRRVREEAGSRRAGRAVRELFDLLWAAPRLRQPIGIGADLRHACRALARTRGFLAVTVATLSIGIALCVSVMVVVNAYLVRGLPYPESDRLFSIRYGQPGGSFLQDLEKLDWHALDDIVEHPIAWDLDFFTLRGAPYAEAAQGTWVTPGYMEGFGVRPAIGRAFLPSDFAAGAPPVAVISHRLWQTRFAGAADILGRRLETYTNDRPDEPQSFAIVGVLPEAWWHLNAFTEVLAPLHGPTHPYMVRLRRGVGPATAAARITALIRSARANLPADWQVEVESTYADYVKQIRPLLLALATATGLVMLIACANVAVLFTVRATARQRELAVRKALGASAGRIARALAAEAVVLAAASTAIGLALAQAVITVTAPLLERHIGRSVPGGAGALQIDATILAGALLTGLFAMAICGAAQLWASSRSPLTLALGAGHKGGSAGPDQRRAHSTLIAFEVAASLTLLVGAALMIESGLRILGVDMGLQTRDVIVSRLSLDQRNYPDAARRNRFLERVAAGIEAAAGPRGVAFANAWPLQRSVSRPVGLDAPQAPLSSRAEVFGVSAAYFDTLGIAVTDGRGFTARDVPGGEPVAVVSRTLAARLWPAARAVGQRLRTGPPQNAAGDPPASYLVVGVAADVRSAHTDNDLADVYLAFAQQPGPAPFVYVRATGVMARIERDMRDVVGRLDPDMALVAARPLSDILDQQRAGARFLAVLLVVFAALAAVLALVGIYGVIAYTVRQREREIAVRLAIGANRTMITRMFLRPGSAVLAAGLVLGIAGAVLLGRLLETQLFGVRAADPAAMLAVAVPFALCGLVAIAWPARAAASTDPASALKN